MTKQFFYRILTSIFLFFAVYLMFIDNIFLILFLPIIFIISYYEFYKLIVLIKMNLKLSYFNFIYYNILFFLYLILAGVERFAIEFIRTNEKYLFEIFSGSQIISMIMIIIGSYFLINPLPKRES